MKFNKSLRPLNLANYDKEEQELTMTNNGHSGKRYWWAYKSTWEAGSTHVCQEQHAQRPGFLGLR